MPGETGMEQVFSDLQALKRLYGLLHKGQAADESLDETSRALLMRMLDDATQQALLRQAKMLSRPLMSPTLERKLSIQPDRLTRDAVPRIGVKLPASPSPSLLASERSRRLKKPQSSVRSRDGHRVLGHHRLSRTAMPGHYADLEQRHGSRRSSKATKPQHDTVDGGTHRGERQDRPRWGSGRGDQSSLERSDCSVSRAPSTPGRPRPHGRATARHVGAEGSSTHRFGRLDYGLSVSITTSRRGSGRAGRGATTPKRSSSSNRTVMIRSRIRPNRELMERCLRRADEEAKGESPRRRRRKDGAVATSVSVGWSSHPRRTLNWIDSKSTYSSSSSGAVSLFPSTSHMASLTSAASASSSSPVSRGSNVPPEYTFEASSASRSCRRRERQERREGRLRRLKNKLALVFHHRHDHHHHYFGHGQSGNQDGFSRHERRTHHRMSLWRYLGGMFHRSTGHERNKKTASRMVASVLVKRRGSGGGVRHMWGAPQQRAPALARMRRTGSRVQVKKLHWWQRLRRRRGRVDVGGRSRKRCLLGQGKKAM